jgi:DNA-binding LacI/PurR family transcriptional regulator
MAALARLGITIPRYLRVVGFDDVRFATLLSVPLNTIQQPRREIAVTAFNALRERIEEPTLPARSLLLTPRLVVRESCGAYLLRRSGWTLQHPWSRWQ